MNMPTGTYRFGVEANAVSSQERIKSGLLPTYVHGLAGSGAKIMEAGELSQLPLSITAWIQVFNADPNSSI